jgi:hypothetical protein
MHFVYVFIFSKTSSLLLRILGFSSPRARHGLSSIFYARLTFIFVSILNVSIYYFQYWEVTGFVRSMHVWLSFFYLFWMSVSIISSIQVSSDLLLLATSLSYYTRYLNYSLDLFSIFSLYFISLGLFYSINSYYALSIFSLSFISLGLFFFLSNLPSLHLFR